MIKKYFLILVLIVTSCTDENVLNNEEQIIEEIVVEEVIIEDNSDGQDGEEIPCVNGFAGNYPCKDYDLLLRIPLEKMGTGNIAGNDSWGWVDTTTAKEYALMGTTQGVTFVDITNPSEAIILGTLKTNTVNSVWRDIKVHNNIAYIVSEATAHGMQLFDLTKLRNVQNPPVNFTADSQYNGFREAHNIVINETSGFAYAVGTKTFAGGPHFVNINTPLSPVAAGGFAAGGYSHDAQVVSYEGPDTDYNCSEILIGSNEDEVVIVDVTDKANPKRISSINYSNIGYTHQGWFTEDSKYFILGDELDEERFGGATRTIIFDFTDLDNPKHHFDYFGPTNAIDHNGYVKGNLFFQASYTAGIRIIDISNIDDKQFTEVGFFDTRPETDDASFEGAWNVYPYLPSGNIIISDVERGLFVVRKSK